jgi:hypothetical protein
LAGRPPIGPQHPGEFLLLAVFAVVDDLAASTVGG